MFDFACLTHVFRACLKARFESEIFTECTGAIHGERVTYHGFNWPHILGKSPAEYTCSCLMVGQILGVVAFCVSYAMLCSFSMSKVWCHVTTSM